MLTKIIDRLKQGTVNRVVAYGVEQLPEPPYIVVRPERNPIGNGRNYRIIVHFLPGQQTFLEDYARNNVFDLLDNYKTNSRHGNYNQVLTEDDWSDIITNNDDGTISMERVFLVPSLIF